MEINFANYLKQFIQFINTITGIEILFVILISIAFLKLKNVVDKWIKDKELIKKKNTVNFALLIAYFLILFIIFDFQMTLFNNLLLFALLLIILLMSFRYILIIQDFLSIRLIEGLQEHNYIKFDDEILLKIERISLIYIEFSDEYSQKTRIPNHDFLKSKYVLLNKGSQNRIKTRIIIFDKDIKAVMEKLNFIINASLFKNMHSNVKFKISNSQDTKHEVEIDIEAVTAEVKSTLDADLKRISELLNAKENSIC